MRVFRTGFGRAVSQVAVEDGLDEEFGRGALLLEFGESMHALFGVLGGGVRGHGVTVRRRGAGDAAVLSAAVLQDPQRSRNIVRLRLRKQGGQNITTAGDPVRSPDLH